MVRVNEKPPVPPHGFGPSSSLSSDGSFVVLERSPPQQERSGQFTSRVPERSVPHLPMNNVLSSGLPPAVGQFHNSTYMTASGSMTSDLSPEEIQKKLHDVLQENVELKETLHQNNLAMKQQFNTLVMWQEEVFKVHQNHKEKFTETRDLILKLRAENTDMKRNLEEGNSGETVSMSTIINQLKNDNADLKLKLASQSQKCEGSQEEGPSKKEQELTSLVEHINHQLEQAEHAKRQLSIDAERLAAQKKRSEQEVATVRREMEEYKDRTRREIERLTEEKEQLGKQNAQLRQNCARMETELQGTSGSSSVMSPVVSASKGQNPKERPEKYKSGPPQQQEQASRMSVTSQKGPSIPQEECAILAVNLEAHEDALHQINAYLERETERFSSLDSWLKATTEKVTRNTNDPQVVQDLKADLEQVKRLLTQEQSSSDENKQKLAGAQVQFKKLFSDYQALLQEWELYHQDKRDKDRHNDAYHEVQARGFAEKIDSLTAQLLLKDEAVNIKTREMDKMLEKLRTLELENEAINILKAQVEVYQSDFNAEREAREHIAGEKERMAEDLRHLQRRNQQLLEDLETYQQNHFDEMQSRQPNPRVTNSWNTIAAPGRGNGSNPPVRQPSPQRSRENEEIQHRENEPQETVENESVFGEEDLTLVRYFCPKCNIGFRELQPLEYHVETCLELTN